MTVFKHLFIFPNYRLVQHFLSGFWEKARDYHQPINNMGGYQRLSLMASDGQHEIIFAIPEDIERRCRGMNFDKVSIHETVELTMELHEFLQYVIYRHSFMGIKHIMDRSLKDNEMYFVKDWPEHRRVEDDRVDAMRYLMNEPLLKIPEIKGLIGDLSV